MEDANIYINGFILLESVFVEDGLVAVNHVAGKEQKADILTKALERIKFKEMRVYIGVQDVKDGDVKPKRENVDLSL